MSLPILIVVSLIFTRFLMTLLLDMLNIKTIYASCNQVPECYKNFIDEESYSKSIAYTLDKIKFEMIENLFGSIVLAAVFLVGFLPWGFGLLESFLGTGIWAQSLNIVILLAVLSIPDLPFDWYNQFRLEERHGFNKSSQALWISDKIKGFALSLLIGVPLLALLIGFFETFPTNWWIFCFVAIVVFQLLMVMIYPRIILPIFNKVEPLKDGELKDKLFTLADKCGFKARSIQVMDGSKRSSHSNAFFTGFGKFRRVIFYDTILEQLSDDEIESVLAHEIGHYKKGHIWKMMFVSFATLGLAFYIMSVLAQSEFFYNSFGFTQSSGFGPVILLFMLLSGLFTFWLSPISNYFSRKNEYEADNYAKKICGTPLNLISALRKLHKKNLGNLTPHPLYSTFHYSHPTLLERERNLQQ